MELSCLRFEFETVEGCRLLAKAQENPKYKRLYYGLACTNVILIRDDGDLRVVFSPILNEPKNLFHCDVLDQGLPVMTSVPPGTAVDAALNYRIEKFSKIWKPFADSVNLLKEQVKAP